LFITTCIQKQCTRPLNATFYMLDKIKYLKTLSNCHTGLFDLEKINFSEL